MPGSVETQQPGSHKTVGKGSEDAGRQEAGMGTVSSSVTRSSSCNTLGKILDHCKPRAPHL